MHRMYQPARMRYWNVLPHLLLFLPSALRMATTAPTYLSPPPAVGLLLFVNACTE